MPDPPSPLELRLLGAPRLSWRGAPIVHASRKEAALLYYLALQPDGVGKAALAELLWGAGHRGNLRVALHHLRRLPGADDWLRDEDPVALRASSDLGRFAAAVDDDPEAALAAWAELPDGRSARGWLLHGVDVDGAPAFMDWLELERERWAAAWSDALLRASERAEQEARYADAARWSRRLLADDPLHETAARAHMRAAWLMGDREGAVAAFERCRRALAEELGLEPLEETLALLKRVRAGPPKPRHHAPSAAVAGGARLRPVAFTGRADELERVRRALAPGHLVTITGPGGIGKTRLAEAVADAWDGPVVRVDLGALGRDSEVAPAVLEALDAGERRGAPLAALPEAMGAWVKRQGADAGAALWLVDEAERVPEGTVTVLDAVLAGTAAPAVLATSRVPLDLPGEAVVRLDGLDEASAVALFAASVAVHAPGFVLEPEDRLAATALARTVGGSPLALTLAATWVPDVTVAEVAAGVDVGLAHAATPHDADGRRHASLQAALDHSWLLLTDTERKVLASASVFPGRFDAEAAAAVAHANLRTLLALVRKSMLQRDRAGRYRMHPVVRMYAAAALDRMGEGRDARDRHAEWALGVLPERLRRPGPTWVVDADAARLAFDDLRAAWDHTVAADPLRLDGAVEGVAAISDQLGRWREGDDWFARAARHPAIAGAPALRAALAVAGARGAGALSRPDAALALLDGVADALPSASERCRAEAERVRGSCLMSYGNHDATEGALERAARGFESVGDDRALASTLNLLGLVAAHRHDPTRAAACYARVLEVAERADLPVARGAALANLASLVPADRPRTERVALLERAVDALRQASFAPALAATLLNLGRRRREAGVPGARAAFEEAAALMEGLGLAAGEALEALAQEVEPTAGAELAARAIADARASADPRTEALAANTLATIEEGRGRPTAADAAFAIALEAAHRPGAGAVARYNVWLSRATVRSARGDRRGALADLAEAIDAAIEQRLDTCLTLATEGARWLGVPADATTERVLRGAVVHARAVGSASAEAGALAACQELGVDPDAGDARVALGAEWVDLTGRAAARPEGALWLDALVALTQGYDLRGRLAAQPSRSLPASGDRAAAVATSAPPAAVAKAAER
jgi:DNA-binding SARP family transcriptional activator/predicted ATPase